MTITNVEPAQTSKLKDILNAPQKSLQEPHHDLKIEPVQMDDGSAMSGYPVTPKEENKDPLADIPVFEITPQNVITMAASTPSTTSPQGIYKFKKIFLYFIYDRRRRYFFY